MELRRDRLARARLSLELLGQAHAFHVRFGDGFLNRTSDNPHFNLESRICNAALLRHARTAFRASGEAGHRSPGEMCTRVLAYQMWLTVSPSSPQTVYVAADLLHPLLEELAETGERLGRRVRMLADEQAPSGSHLFDTRQELRRAAGLSSLDSAGAVAPRHQVCAYLGFSRCVAAGEEPVRGTVAEHAAELTRQTDHVLVDWLALVYARQLTPSPTSNQVSTFSRSAMLFRASDPSVASLETPMVSVGEWYNSAMKGVTPVNK